MTAKTPARRASGYDRRNDPDYWIQRGMLVRIRGLQGTWRVAATDFGFDDHRGPANEYAIWIDSVDWRRDGQKGIRSHTNDVAYIVSEGR